MNGLRGIWLRGGGSSAVKGPRLFPFPRPRWKRGYSNYEISLHNGPATLSLKPFQVPTPPLLPPHSANAIANTSVASSLAHGR